MYFLELFPINNMKDAILASLFAIMMVFIVLGFIIFISWLCSKGITKYEVKTQINAKPENKIVEEDEDALIASLVATMDFYKETKKDARLVKVERIDN